MGRAAEGVEARSLELGDQREVKKGGYALDFDVWMYRSEASADIGHDGNLRSPV